MLPAEVNPINCLQVLCMPHNDSRVVVPGTYFLCNEDRNQNLTQAFCSEKSSEPTEWFKNSLLQTYVADFKSNSYQISKECEMSSQLLMHTDSEYCSQNASCCLSKDLGKIFGKTPCGLDYDCKDVSLYNSEQELNWNKAEMKTLLAFEFLVGFFAIVGNIVVIVNSTLVLRRNARITSKEIKVYNILLLNLAVADFLMGVYVIGVTTGGLTSIVSQTKLAFKDNKTFQWLSHSVCSGLGTINFVSSQVSVSALVAISCLRLYGVYYPYRKLNLKVITAVAAMVWVFWIAISCIPILRFEPFKTNFVDEVEFPDKENLKKLRYFHFRYILQMMLIKISKFCGFSLNNGYIVRGRMEWDNLFELAKNLKVFTDEDLKGITYLSYYSVRRICAPRFLVHHFNKFFYFSIIVLAFNSASFTIIFLAQLGIAKKSFDAPEAKKKSCSNWIRIFEYASKSQNPMLKRREIENQRMRRQMFLIVATDFCCWIPITVISSFYTSYTAQLDVCEFLKFREESEEWFYIFAIIVLPLNSVINPFLYSYSAKRSIKSMFLQCYDIIISNNFRKQVKKTEVTTVSNSSM